MYHYLLYAHPIHLQPNYSVHNMYTKHSAHYLTSSLSSSAAREVSSTAAAQLGFSGLCAPPELVPAFFGGGEPEAALGSSSSSQLSGTGSSFFSSFFSLLFAFFFALLLRGFAVEPDAWEEGGGAQPMM